MKYTVTEFLNKLLTLNLPKKERERVLSDLDNESQCEKTIRDIKLIDADVYDKAVLKYK